MSYGPSEKQISYALSLLARHGYDTNWMSAQHSKLGATMRERQGKVVAWLEGMTRQRISQLIDSLKEG